MKDLQDLPKLIWLNLNWLAKMFVEYFKRRRSTNDIQELTQDRRDRNVDESVVGVQHVWILPFGIGAVVTVDHVQVERVGQELHGVDDH